MIRKSILTTAAAVSITALSCGGPPRGSPLRNNLSLMQTASLTIHNSADEAHTFSVWLARTVEQQMLGLMNVRDDELGPDQGMLFCFDEDDVRGFWMRNTLIPLDIAFIRSDGTIVRILTMTPLDERTYSSIEPARFALEVRAGQFAARDIAAGDRVEIPQHLLNPGS